MRGLKGLITAAAITGAATLLLTPRRTRDIAGKSVLITGGSRGLGLALSREFARQGCRVAICARDPEEISRALSDEELARSEAVGRVCDITNPDQVREMIGELGRLFGGIDILVNNAGVIQVGPAELMTLADYEEAINTHFWGPLYITLEVLPEMRSRGDGRIVNIASIGGKIAVPHLLPYCASKFALVGFSEGLHAEVAKYGISVTTVCPGLMRTGSPRNAIFKGQHRAEYAWFSILDALPVFSIEAARAANQIVLACRNRRASLTLTPPAKVATRLAGLFPDLSASILAGVNAILPAPGGIGTSRAKGSQSESAFSPSILTIANEQAAREYNEIAS